MYADVFNLKDIHEKYWKDFCDVCYSRFGFEAGENRTYEQKYETFSRCKMFVTEQQGYEQQLLLTHEEDLQRLHDTIDIFYSLCDADDMIPMLFALSSISTHVADSLKEDTKLIKYMCPRSSSINYLKYQVSSHREFRGDIRGDIRAIDVKDEDLKTIINRLDNAPFIDPSSKISSAASKIAFQIINYYNACLLELVDALSDGTNSVHGHELQAFLYRLFMSFEDSLPEIKDRLEDFPSPRNLNSLRDEYQQAVKIFKESQLGKHWVECIAEKDGLFHMAKYFMHEQKHISENEEIAFFYNLDKICIISDILNGNAEKYWLDIKYPDDWNFSASLSSKSKASSTKSKAPIPYTISYDSDLSPQTRTDRLNFIRRIIEKLGWFQEIQDADDFEHLFSGKHRDCNIRWSDEINLATAYFFLQQLLKQRYVKKESGCTARSLMINQFHVANPRSDISRVADYSKVCIQRILILLDPANPIPSARNFDDNDLDIMNDTYWTIYQDNLHTRKGVY